MDLAAEIREQVASYLSGRLPIADLWRWLQDRLWDIDNREHPVTASMAHEIELLLSETAHGDWTENELREKLRPITSMYEFTVGPRGVTTSSGPVGTIILRPPRVLQVA